MAPPAIHGLPASALDEGLMPIRGIAIMECMDVATGEIYLQLSYTEEMTCLDAFSLATYGVNECENDLIEAGEAGED